MIYLLSFDILPCVVESVVGVGLVVGLIVVVEVELDSSFIEVTKM